MAAAMTAAPAATNFALAFTREFARLRGIAYSVVEQRATRDLATLVPERVFAGILRKCSCWCPVIRPDVPNRDTILLNQRRGL